MTLYLSQLLPFLFLSNIVICNAYKLLIVFPLPIRSHQLLGEGYVRLLSKAGHEITYVSPFPMKNIPVGVRQIAVDTQNFLNISIVGSMQKNQQPGQVGIVNVIENSFVYFGITLRNAEVQKLMHDTTEEFDLVIAEWLYTETIVGLGVVFNCPFIWSSTMAPHSLVLSLIDEYLNPAYTVHHLSQDYGFSFWQRVHQLWMIAHASFWKWIVHSQEEKLYIEMFGSAVSKRGRSLPAYEDVKYNSSLVFGNSYVSSGEALALPENYKYIGGYHIPKEIDPLPEDLQEIMDNAEHGVIYFSMGSALRSSQLPKDITEDILEVFRALKQTVIWKFEDFLTDLPKNVHVLPWAPQLSILAHPNCVLFISHGGILSIHEALHFGVPIIGIPHYLDQFMNINSAQNKGFAKKVNLYQDGSRQLDSAIREMLNNPSYRERAREYSFIHHHRPVSPQQELVHWVEHVIRTRGALHLRSPALLVPWYQKYYVDLAAVILILIVGINWLHKRVWKILKGSLKKKIA